MNRVWKVKADQHTLVLPQIAVIADNGIDGLIVHMTGNAPPIVVESDGPGYGTLIAWSELDDKIDISQINFRFSLI